jgi:ribonucleoside-diphosphate reductase alpha chain
VRSPQDHVGTIHSSNLCTEITLNTSAEEVAVCNLGSVNLARHFENGAFSSSLIEETVTLAMRMLDNVIDLNLYPIPEAKTANMRHRPVGMGILGFQDALHLQKLAFESEDAMTFADRSMELISYHAILASSKLAAERGAYESYKGSKWDRGILPVDTIALLEEARGEQLAIPRGGVLDWGPVRESIRAHGMRNSNCMAIAPTATISNICGCFPSIEPVYKQLYVKSNMSGEFTVYNRFLIDALKDEGLWNDEFLQALKHYDGSIQSIPHVSGRLKGDFKTAFEIGPEWLIEAAARRGKWIDQSQSLNIFLQTTSGKRISEVYQLAWKKGLKTTYYLRTMGASGVEKSTVALSAASTPAASTAEPPATDIRVCGIDDPTCESCQ